MGKMSKDKGKRGELEVVALLHKYGFEARRGQQFRGGGDSPDVIHTRRGLSVEVKLRETLSLYPALEKAAEDDADKAAIVFHRRNRKPWIVAMYAEDFLELMKEMYDD